MRFVSTAGESAPVGVADAVRAGLAVDGGLYAPQELPRLTTAEIAALADRSPVEIAAFLSLRLLGDEVGEALLRGIVEDALDFPIPLVEIEDRVFCLELFHGPTLAFKDVGARFMARLLAALRSGDEPELCVLVATSGDTGSAVAHAFHHVEGFRVVVLFPKGQISEAQQKLFTTLEDNVLSVAVSGSFDDCQRLAKQAFADRELRHRIDLASANSINVGRLLPQIFYYFMAFAQLPQPSRDLVVATPSGNFGNLTAGLMAKAMGLPVGSFVAATNANDVVPEYLHTGTFRPRASVATLSNAMDVGNPSNFERILHLYRERPADLRRDLRGFAYSDAETLEAMAALARRGVLLDPHSAIGYLGLGAAMQELSGHGSGIFLATAHPAKFAQTVARATGRPVPLPPALQQALERRESVLELEADYPQLRALLLSGRRHADDP